MDINQCIGFEIDRHRLSCMLPRKTLRHLTGALVGAVPPAISLVRVLNSSELFIT